MGREEIVARVLSDAEKEADGIVADAKKRAEEIISAANAEFDREIGEAETEAYARAKLITDGKAAAARLDSQKVLLAEKRRVIDGVYYRALAQLLCLNKHESVALAEKLLREHAAEGDEIVFAENFAYAEDVKALPVIKEKKLTVSGERPKLSGGFLLRGKTCDKDITYAAILEADREEHQAEIAVALFGTNS